MRIRRTPAARRARVALLGVAAIIGALALAFPVGSEGIAGSAGVDTSLPPTDSAVTVSGRGPFADLRITVNQTKHLLNQAVSITWTGGRPTLSGPGTFAGNYLQIMQCWGEADGTIAENPGPPPEQCVQGAKDAIYGGASGGLFPAGSYTTERIISAKTWDGFDPNDGVVDDHTGFLWKPFRGVDGTTVGVHKDPTFNPAVSGGNYWLNPFFNIVTTNEIASGRTGANGEGAELFEVTTGLESSGLGCGQKVEPVAGGEPKVPTCWLVIVPRGTPAEENVGTPFEKDAKTNGTVTSPLSPSSWKNRIAIPLEFNPLDTPCNLAEDQRRVVGSELASGAISSWQPALCQKPGLEPYAYGSIGDASARSQILNALPGAPGMAIVSRPVDKDRRDPDDPVVYAPMTLSGAVIGFNIERTAKTSSTPDQEKLNGVRVAQLNLTPRLVAKLLTQSYLSSVTILAIPPYDWVKHNPSSLGDDPDFLRFNPEFAQLQVTHGKNFAGLVLPAGITDVARQVWDWVLADPEAKAWVAGTPDPWGMNVNPVYSTDPAANPNGASFADPVPDSFPKSDPYCYHYDGPPLGSDGTVEPAPLCGTDWLPYTQSLHDAARLTRLADDASKTVLNSFALTADQVWKRDVPQTVGSRTILSFTDSASAIQYGIQMARLSRAGDDGDDRSFIAADTSGLTAGVEAMKADDEPTVLEPDPLVQSATAYPLTTLTYAAVAPLSLDDAGRTQYAAFIDYASGDGQAPGQLLGQLPPGYAPLPAGLRTQAIAAAKTIRSMQPVPEESDDLAEPDAPAVLDEGSTTDTTPASSTPSFDSSSARVRAPSPHALHDIGPVAVPAAPVVPATSTPEKEPVITRTITPIASVPRAGMVIPALAIVALLAALASLEITKRPRRATSQILSGRTP